MTSEAKEIFREKKVVKNPIKFKIQLNEEQKEAKQLILDNTITLVDEAQNVTHDQMEMISTRIGLRSKMMVCGDAHQTDLKKKSDSGFKYLYKASRKVKNLEAITLKSNHRNEIVEDLRDYYTDNPIY
jgi:phosphate starvation-inducible protein PhoH